MTREDMIAALESAHAEVADMCQRQWEGKPAINWSIQARHGDSDIAISQAIRAVLAALRATPEGTPQTAAPVSLREYAQHKVDCECVRPQMFRGVTLGEGGRCTCGLAAALSAAPPAPQPAHSKCQTCGASKELCLEYKLTALSVGGNRCCSLCNHEAAPSAPTETPEAMPPVEIGDIVNGGQAVLAMNVEHFRANPQWANTIHRVIWRRPAPTGGQS